MGRGAGTGSPGWFRCHDERRGLGDPSGKNHTVKLTGRSKPYHAKRMLGSRSDFVTREYECSCGHVGWSNHIDLAYRAGEKPQGR